MLNNALSYTKSGSPLPSCLSLDRIQIYQEQEIVPVHELGLFQTQLAILVSLHRENWHFQVRSQELL